MADKLKVAEEVSKDFAVIENANPSAVKQAEGDAFDSDQFGGRLIDADIKIKPNAKLPKRFDESEYSDEDNQPKPDRNPFSAEIKTKNDKARSIIIPLLNPMQKQQGERLNGISIEISRELQAEEQKPKPDEEKIQQLKNTKTQIDKKRLIGDEGRKGIEFPPREEGQNVDKIN